MIVPAFLVFVLACAPKSQVLAPDPRLLDVLAPPDGVEGDLFGAAVAIDGAWVAIAASSHDHGGGLGAVYLYRRVAARGPWEFQAEVPLSLTVGAGIRLDLRGSTLVVGAPNHGLGGALFVFERDPFDPSVWTPVASHFGAHEDGLGTSITLAGDTIVAGAPDQCSPLICIPDENVEIYERDLGGPNAWGRLLVLPSPAVSACGSSFGTSVAFDGDRLFVGRPSLKCGASGGMELYGRNVSGPNSWMHVSSLTPTVGFPQRFGNPIALQDELVASFGHGVPPPPALQQPVPLLEVRAENRGGPGAWGVVALLSFREVSSFPLLLNFVQRHILVGIPGNGTQTGPGIVLLRIRTGPEYRWNDSIAVFPPRSEPGDRFGFALASNDQFFVVGAPGTTLTTVKPRIGEAYVYSIGKRDPKSGQLPR